MIKGKVKKVFTKFGIDYPDEEAYNLSIEKLDMLECIEERLSQLRISIKEEIDKKNEFNDRKNQYVAVKLIPTQKLIDEYKTVIAKNNLALEMTKKSFMHTKMEALQEFNKDNVFVSPLKKLNEEFDSLTIKKEFYEVHPKKRNDTYSRYDGKW